MPAQPERPTLRMLYEQCAPSAFRRARQILRHEDDAWDVVHDVFLKLAARDVVLDGESAMRYLYRAVTHQCLNRIKSSARRNALAPSPDATDIPESGGAATARNLLAKLAPHTDEIDQQIIVLHYMDGLPQEEVAQILNLWRRTVGRRLKRLRVLAESLAEPAPAGVLS